MKNFLLGRRSGRLDVERLLRALEASSLAVAVAVIAGRTEAHPPYRTPSEFIQRLTSPGRAHPLADQTGRLPVMVTLPDGADARAFGLLPVGPGLATLRLAPEDYAAFEAEHPDFGLAVWPKLHPVLDASKHWNRIDTYRAALASVGTAAPAAGTGKGVVVGIVDSGLDVTHADFLDASGKTRVAWLLDMSSSALGLHADLEAQYGCTSSSQTSCAVLSADDIDRYIAAASSNVPRDVVGHGTHVASIAAGNGGSTGKYQGVAPEATLIIAKVTDSSGGVSDPDIATGVQFVFERAASLPGAPPTVVNLSLGGDYGPHDGTLELETSLAAMVGPSHPGRAIVVAAGNSAALYASQDNASESLGIHTEVRVAKDAPAHLPVRVPGTAGTTVSGSAYFWLTFRPGDAISVGLSGPGAVHIDPVAVGSIDSFENTTVEAAIDNGVYDPKYFDLTQDTHGAIVFVSGRVSGGVDFTLDLTGEGTAEIWVQGGDGLGETDTDPGVLFRMATHEQTVSVPATHPSLLAVGCTVDRTQWTDHAGVLRTYTDLGDSDGACYFSSAGPTATGVRKPELSAPGGLIIAAMSRDADPRTDASSIFAASADICPTDSACFVADNTHAVLSGSSMSAPQVAGAVALLFERDAALTQDDVSRLLQEGARLPTGSVPLDYQMGVGALDVAGAMVALDQQVGTTSAAAVDGLPGVSPDVSVAASWMSLSASYLRPDSTWPVTGVVKLRTTTDGIADITDTSRLHLATTGPVVVTAPLTRTGPGLFTFTVTGADGGGQQDATLDLTLDGQVLGASKERFSGHRVLSIAPDRWIAHGDIRATSGCSVRPGVGAHAGTTEEPGWPRDESAWAWVALLSCTAWAARRRGLGTPSEV